MRTTTLLRQVLAATGMTALVVSAVIPCYCLLITPGAAMRAYADVYEAFGSTLPPITEQCALFPKLAMIAVWLTAVGFQAWMCIRLRPRWRALGVAAAQLGIAAVISVLFVCWHVGSVHLPALKLLYDLAV